MKLVGYVDGIEVRFDFYPPNLFKTEIPKQIDGTYILQLHVVDDAGNITSYSNIFVKIDFKQLYMEVLSSNFNFIENGLNMGFKPLDKDFTYKNINNNFDFMLYASDYSYRELMIK